MVVVKYGEKTVEVRSVLRTLQNVEKVEKTAPSCVMGTLCVARAWLRRQGNSPRFTRASALAELGFYLIGGKRAGDLETGGRGQVWQVRDRSVARDRKVAAIDPVPEKPLEACDGPGGWVCIPGLAPSGARMKTWGLRR